MCRSQPKFLVETKLVEQCDVDQVVLADFKGRYVAPADPPVNNVQCHADCIGELFPMHDWHGRELRH